MNIDKTKVFMVAGASLVAALIVTDGPKVTPVAVELGLFHFKVAVICIVIGVCLKSEEKR